MGIDVVLNHATTFYKENRQCDIDSLFDIATNRKVTGYMKNRVSMTFSSVRVLHAL